MSGSNMQITPEQGAFMGMLVEVTGARSIVEVGVYTGYSSLAMALALPEGGKLYAFDRDETSMAVARRWGRGLPPSAHACSRRRRQHQQGGCWVLRSTAVTRCWPCAGGGLLHHAPPQVAPSATS